MAESGIGPGTTGTTPVTFSGTAADNADGVAPVATGIIRMAAELFGFDNSNWDRIKAYGDNADAVAANTFGALLSLARQTLFNGSTWDRWRSMSAVGDGLGVALAATPAATYIVASATNAVANATFAAVAGQKHRLMSVTGNYVNAPISAGNVTVADNGTTLLAWAGTVTPLSVPCPSGGILASAVNQTMGVAIGAGGAGVIGNVIATKLTA